VVGSFIGGCAAIVLGYLLFQYWRRYKIAQAKVQDARSLGLGDNGTAVLSPSLSGSPAWWASTSPSGLSKIHPDRGQDPLHTLATDIETAVRSSSSTSTKSFLSIFPGGAYPQQTGSPVGPNSPEGESTRSSVAAYLEAHEAAESAARVAKAAAVAYHEARMMTPDWWADISMSSGDESQQEDEYEEEDNNGDKGSVSQNNSHHHHHHHFQLHQQQSQNPEETGYEINPDDGVREAQETTGILHFYPPTFNMELDDEGGVEAHGTFSPTAAFFDLGERELDEGMADGAELTPKSPRTPRSSPSSKKKKKKNIEQMPKLKQAIAAVSAFRRPRNFS